MEELVLFILTFIFVFIIYEIFIIAPQKKKKMLDKNTKEIVEIKYLITRYQLLQICGIVSSLDIALVVGIVAHVHGLIIELLVGIFSALIIIILSYHLIYLFYKKKGMIKNGKHK